MIEQSLFNKLTGEEWIARSLRNDDGSFRIYPGLIEEREPTPNIAYEKGDDQAIAHMGGVTGLAHCMLVLNIWDTDQEGASRIAEEIRLELSGLSRTYVGPHYINRMTVADRGEVTATVAGNRVLNRKGVQLELDIWYTQQPPSP